MKTSRVLSVLLAAALAVQGAFAFRSGISPLDSVVELIAEFFYFPSLQNETVAVGFARFVFFIIIFSVLNWAGRRFVFTGSKGGGVLGNVSGNKGLDKKTSNIVAVCIALISAFLVPESVILTSASAYAALIWILITLGPAILAFVLGFFIKEKDGVPKTASKRVLELVWLLIGFGWSWFMWASLLPWISNTFPGNITNLVELINSWMYVIMAIAIFVKLFQIIFGLGDGPEGGLAGKVAKGINNIKNAVNDVRDDPFRNKNREPVPGQVQEVEFEKAGPNTVRVTWKKNPEDNIAQYWVEGKYTDQTWPHGILRHREASRNEKWFKKNRIMVSSGTNSVTVTQMVTPKFGLQNIDTTQHMVFRVCAVNGLGVPGKYGYSEAKKVDDHPPGHPTRPLSPEEQQETEQAVTDSSAYEMLADFESNKQNVEESLRKMEETVQEFHQRRSADLVDKQKKDGRYQHIPILHQDRIIPTNENRADAKMVIASTVDQIKQFQGRALALLQHPAFETLSNSDKENVYETSAEFIPDSYARVWRAVGILAVGEDNANEPGVGEVM